MTTTFRIPGLVLTEHEFPVPLDHARPDGTQITVFAREVADPDGLDRPFLVFLQGGPGFEAPRPIGPASGWLGRVLRDYRVLMLDQRGTGRSTPIGDLPGMTPQQQADYLALFRADSIVRDAELVRKAMGVEKWSVLGQSFGGFCAMTYLSIAPEGLREAMFTGGVPPVGVHPDEVYAATYRTMRDRNRRYYLRYPDDRERVLRIKEMLDGGDGVMLPDGDQLTFRRFRQIGSRLGMADGAEHVHYLLEQDPRSPAFGYDVAGTLFSSRNPLYVVIHEACYADGAITNWSAERMLPADFADDPTLLTGEHVYSWMLTDYGRLGPLREAAELLAQREWPRLYDEDRLRACTVPAAAAVYAEDAYVDRSFSEATAAMIPTMRPWLTNEYQHSGIGENGDHVLDRLIGLVKGRL
jgi:pimeloyl-ACP methyl ester carboxylesterase